MSSKNTRARRKYEKNKEHWKIRRALNALYSVCTRHGVNLCAVARKLGPRPSEEHHIDHVHPLHLFDHNNSVEVRAAWHPENLQWAHKEVNGRKGAYYNPAEFINYAKRHGIKMINSKAKGNRWERAVCSIMEKIYGEKNVYNGRQTTKEHDIPDVITPELAIECKVGARPNLLAALEQCERDAGPRKLNVGRYCVVYAKFDNKKPVVLMRASDFEDLITTRRELSSK